MAKLISEDTDYKSVLELRAGSPVTIKDQNWQRYALILTNGPRTISLGDDQVEYPALFCRQPKDEVLLLADMLDKVVTNKRTKILFEPAEPCFELTIERTGPVEMRVEIWLDSGNAETEIFRWDSFGMRFLTIENHVASFLKDLKGEFAC